MRSYFDDQLSRLNSELLMMGALCEDAISCAVKCLTESDPTLAFQVPEELFQKIKDYLQRNNMTQKDFVIGLIETEIDRDLTQRAAMNVHMESEEMSEEQKEAQETAPVNDCESVSEEVEEEYRKQENNDYSEDFEAEEEECETLNEDEELEEGLDETDEQCEDEDIIEEQEESDCLVMSMGM